MDLNAVLGHAVRAEASDVHLKVGQPPVFRADRELTLAADFGPLGDAELEAMLDCVTAAVPRRRQRFPVSGFRQRGAISFAFRVIFRDSEPRRPSPSAGSRVAMRYTQGLPAATALTTRVKQTTSSNAS